MEFSGGGNTSYAVRTSASNTGTTGGGSGTVNPGTMTVTIGDICVSFADSSSASITGGATSWTYTTTGASNGTQYYIAGSTSVTGSFTPAGGTPWTAQSVAFYSSSGGSVNLGSVALQAKFGIIPAPKFDFPLGTPNLQAKLGITPAPKFVFPLGSATLKGKFGIVSSSLSGSLGTSSLEAKFGITPAKIVALLEAEIQAKLGIQPAPSLQGGSSSTPGLVQSKATGMDIFGLQAFVITFPNPSLAGNLLVVGFQFGSHWSISSVKDSNGTSWTAGPTFTNGTYAQEAAIYYLADAPAGTASITVTFSGSNSGSPNCRLNGWFKEFYNIAASSPVDGTPVSSSSSVSPGTITTTQNGDLILHWALDLSDSGVNGGGYNNNPITAGSGFTPDTNDNQVGSFVQYQVQATAGGISPTCTVSGSATWGSLAMAFKAASQGTAPTGFRIVHVQGYGMCGYASGTAPQAMAFPCTGNLIVGLFNYEQVTAVSDSASNSYTVLTPANNSAAAGANMYGNCFYAPNATTSPTLHSLQVTLSANGAQCYMMLYDIMGAATSPFDVSATNVGNDTSSGSYNTVAITPNHNGEIIIAGGPVYYNTIDSISPGILDSDYNTYDNNYPNGGGTQPSPLSEDNMQGHYYQTTAALVTFAWNYNTLGVGTPNVGVSYWAAIAAAFKAPSGTINLGTAALEAAFGITHAQIVATVKVNMQMHAGITHAQIISALNSSLQSRFGVTHAAMVESLGSVDLQSRFGITTAQGVAILASGMRARFGIFPAPVLEGGTPVQNAAVIVIYCDGFGVSRAVDINGA
jgi:hypothetical protein